MNRSFLAFLLLLLVQPFTQEARAQFQTDQLEIRIGYNLHNAHAKRFNTLIDAFNDQRYPFVVAQNLPNLNWMHGMVVGGTYRFREDLYFHAVFKGRRQFLEAPYASEAFFQQYLFRQHSLELGVTIPIKEERAFSHFLGFGVLLGNMGVYAATTPEKGYEGARKMINVDNTGVFGLSLSYEAQVNLHPHFKLYFRPVMQYALPSQVRKLTDFMDPDLQDGIVTYGEGEPAKFDRGTLNGLGVEGGLLILLPEL